MAGITVSTQVSRNWYLRHWLLNLCLVAKRNSLNYQLRRSLLFLNNVRFLQMINASVPRFCRCADAALASNCIAPTEDINNLAGFGRNHFRPWPKRSKINRPQNVNQNHGNCGSSLPVCRSVHVVCISEMSENNFAAVNET
jgi:hypothetical protein